MERLDYEEILLGIFKGLENFFSKTNFSEKALIWEKEASINKNHYFHQHLGGKLMIDHLISQWLLFLKKALFISLL